MWGDRHRSNNLFLSALTECEKKCLINSSLRCSSLKTCSVLWEHQHSIYSPGADGCRPCVYSTNIAGHCCLILIAHNSPPHSPKYRNPYNPLLNPPYRCKTFTFLSYFVVSSLGIGVWCCCCCSQKMALGNYTENTERHLRSCVCPGLLWGLETCR